MVPGKGLEPPHLAALAPETSASTNFATRACKHFLRQQKTLPFQRIAKQKKLLTSAVVYHKAKRSRCEKHHQTIYRSRYGHSRVLKCIERYKYG